MISDSVCTIIVLATLRSVFLCRPQSPASAPLFRAPFFAPCIRVSATGLGSALASPGLADACFSAPVFLLPLTHPFTAARLVGLQATVVLLLTLLIKSRLLQLKMGFLGSLLALAMLLSFAATTGLLTLITAGSLAYGLSQRKAGSAPA